MNLNKDETLLDAWRQQVKERRPSSFPDDAPTGTDESTGPEEICSVEKLQDWVKKNPQAVLDLLNQYRKTLEERKIYIQMLDEQYCSEAGDHHKKVKTLTARLAESQASLKTTKTLLEVSRESFQKLSKDFADKSDDNESGWGSVNNTQPQERHCSLTRPNTPATSEGLSNNLPTCKTAKLPDPPPFSGNGYNDTATYRVWKRKVEDKLELDKELYPTEKEKFAYVFSRLDSHAADYVYQGGSFGAVEIAADLFEMLDDFYT